MLRIGFIGVGNMGGALAAAASKSGNAEILVTDYDKNKSAEVSSKIGAKDTDAEKICKTAKYIFLGVKPQVLPSVLDEIAPFLKSRTDNFCLVSMAAGIKIQRIIDVLGFSVPVIRIMPNMPVAVGQGMVLYCAEKTVECDELVTVMQHSGVWAKIEESAIDAASAVSGCGPAFVFMFIKALALGGEKSGLDFDTALTLAAQTVMGSAKMLMQSEKTADELRDAVCSPGGSTIEGVKSLYGDNLDETVIKAVEKSFKRTIELGK